MITWVYLSQHLKAFSHTVTSMYRNITNTHTINTEPPVIGSAHKTERERASPSLIFHIILAVRRIPHTTSVVNCPIKAHLPTPSTRVAVCTSTHTIGDIYKNE